MDKRFTAEAALQKVSASEDNIYGILLRHGMLELGFYKPQAVDTQVPHDRDEVYVIKSGSGFFVVENERLPFAAGDALFVPALAEHRFEDFTEDFATWVIFCGPSGGE